MRIVSFVQYAANPAYAPGERVERVVSPPSCLQRVFWSERPGWTHRKEVGDGLSRRGGSADRNTF